MSDRGNVGDVDGWTGGGGLIRHQTEWNERGRGERKGGGHCMEGLVAWSFGLVYGGLGKRCISWVGVYDTTAAFSIGYIESMKAESIFNMLLCQLSGVYYVSLPAMTFSDLPTELPPAELPAAFEPTD